MNKPVEFNHLYDEQPGVFPGNVLIFAHPASEFYFTPDADIYRINDSRFNDLTLYTDIKAFMRVFNENFEKALQSPKRTFIIGYNHLMAKVVKLCLDTYFSDCLFAWRIVSFFHNDKETAQITYTDGENALDDKFGLIFDMLNFPYIKKIEIPYKTVLTRQSLEKLVL